MQHHNTLFILCGEAFSGKSTLADHIAKHYGAHIVGRDLIYFSLADALALEETPEEDDDAFWKNMWPIAMQGVRNLLLTGQSVVFDDNCLLFRQREELREIATACGARSVLIYLNVPADILKKRKDANKLTRERHDVPSAWLADDARLFERPEETEKILPYTPDEPAEMLWKRIEQI
ncbi:AAA family ATPase [Candidatus Kaiserbacteria bacterium]|nr:AAA family ATPase [Candidatus Kaiserbacteria bacterium]